MPTISRRLASAGIADPGDLKSPSLPGASPGSPTGVWLIGNSRPIRLKIEQPWECKSPHADQSELNKTDYWVEWVAVIVSGNVTELKLHSWEQRDNRERLASEARSKAEIENRERFLATWTG